MGGALLLLVILFVVFVFGWLMTPNTVKIPNADTRTETTTTDIEPGTFGKTLVVVLVALLVIGIVATLLVVALDQANIVPNGTAEYWRSVGNSIR